MFKELWSEGAGLFAACFIAIVPGYISRSVAGSYDNEVPMLWQLMILTLTTLSSCISKRWIDNIILKKV